jgi:hypothetical protein
MTDHTQAAQDLDVEHMPSTDEGFNPDTVEPLRRRIQDYFYLYVEQHEREELPVSLLDFAVDLIYGVGQRAGRQEALSQLRIEGKHYEEVLRRASTDHDPR